MSLNLYTPFLDATRGVFEMMLDLSDFSDNPVESSDGADTLDIAIGILGDLQGEVTYRFPRKTSLSMVNIMSGMEIDHVDDFVTSAIAEIANIISGNVLTTLSGSDLKCDILPPEIRHPDNSKAYQMRTACCITTSVGDVYLDIRLNPAK